MHGLLIGRRARAANSFWQYYLHSFQLLWHRHAILPMVARMDRRRLANRVALWWCEVVLSRVTIGDIWKIYKTEAVIRQFGIGGDGMGKVKVLTNGSRGSLLILRAAVMTWRKNGRRPNFHRPVFARRLLGVNSWHSSFCVQHFTPS